MKKTKHFLNIREVIIGYVIIIAIIVIGSFNDLEISKQLFNPENVPAFAILFSVIGNYPKFIGLVFVGSLLFLMARQLDSWKKVLSYIGSAGCMGFGCFKTFDEAFELDSFHNLMDSNNLIYIKILFIVMGVLCSIMVFLFSYFRLKDKSIRELFRVAFFLGMLIFFQTAGTTGAKYIISRPRPRFVYSINAVESGFKNWWEFNPFAAFSNPQLKSCPSGHAGGSLLLSFVLPAITLLREDKSKNELLKVVFFYIGLAWALAVGLSRAYAGAHYISDIGIGYFICLTVGYVCTLFLDYRIKVTDAK